MKTQFTKTLAFCLAAGLFCMSAQAEEIEESQVIGMGTCKEAAPAKKESCKMNEKSCGQKKEAPRKSAARKVIEGS
jgi:hypothetical protein